MTATPAAKPATSRRSAQLRAGPAVLAAFAALALSLGGCEALQETADKARMKLFGVTVTDPEPGSAEWVLKEVVESALDKDEERGWERFQVVLHSEERTPNALRSWYDHAWKRMRRQMPDYVNEDRSFKIVDFKKMLLNKGGLAGYEFFIESHKKEMPTPCSIYIDEAAGGEWRVRRCSL
jgi:hypothetical protein